MTKKLPIGNYKFIKYFNRNRYLNSDYSCLLNCEIYTTDKVRSFWCDIYVFSIKSRLHRYTRHSARHFCELTNFYLFLRILIMLYCNNAK